MNVHGVNAFFSPGATGADRTLVLTADQEFNLTLKLGQVLKGKVLRYYEGGRYSVSFGGQEKVVDSAVPLRVGDTLQGRVIAIDDKVHLQRIVDSGRGDDPINAMSGRPGDDITALFDRHLVQLSRPQHQALVRLVSRLGGSNLVAPSALILSKLGLPHDPELIQAVLQVLDQARGSGYFNTTVGPQLPVTDANGVVSSVVVQQLAPLLARLVDDVAMTPGNLFDEGPTADTGQDGSQDAREHDRWQLGQWLLNVQAEGSLAHRYLRFPIWLDDRLIEVTMALYSQRDRQAGSSGSATLRHHKAVFSLETEHLGTVEIEAIVADRHLRLTVNVEHEYAAERLAEYLTTLTAALRANDWKVDEIRYGIRDELSGVMRSIVEHHVTPDSLSRLM